MKIVLDTNVLVSGIFFQSGVCTEILDRWMNGEFRVYATPSILEEYIRVIDRIASRKKIPLEHNWHTLLPELCHMISGTIPEKRICRDAADDKFLFCALEARVQYLVSGDLDLGVLGSIDNVKILSPRKFLDTLDKYKRSHS